MPAISSRMSCSSSTTRSSGAISDPFFVIPSLRLACRLLFQREDQAHFRARFVILPVAKRDFAPMLLDDLAHDGETEARAFRARRHIGLGQAVALAVRQADAVVHDGENYPRAL